MTEIPEDIMIAVQKAINDCGHFFANDGELERIVATAILAERASLSSELDRLREENAKLEDWSKAWHRTVETMCVLIGINGSASPEEILDELQSRTAALSPDNSTQKKEG